MLKDNGELVLLDPFISIFPNFQKKPEIILPYEAYHYISPEHIKGQPLSIKTDFFAVGIILYQMITGQLPFIRQSERELANAIVNDKIETELLKSKEINSIRLLVIEKLLSKNPADRFKDCVELLSTLKELSSIDETVKKIRSTHTDSKNPRRYLLIPILVALIFILWFVLTSDHIR